MLFSLRASLLGALLPALALAACSDGPVSEASAASAVKPDDAPRHPNVIIFLTDTERRGNLSAYGHSRPTSPFFDQVAQQGFLFESAYTPVSWTRPAVASLFTGTYPQRHGVQMRQDILPPRLPTLAQLLLDAGWRTYMINTNPHITDSWGMTRGFEHAVHLMPHPDQFKAGNGANEVLRHLRRLLPELQEPFFLYVHLIDPHYPFEPPQKDLDAIGVTEENPASQARYDGEIHYADRHIESMARALDDAGLLESSILVEVADHGDEFYEHGSTGHGKTLYQEVVQIPLAMQLSNDVRQRLAVPGDGGPLKTCPRIDANVSLVDLLPTILDLTGVRAPARLDGRSMVPLMRCEPADASRPLFFSVEKEHASLGATLIGHTKLIVDRATGQRRLFFLDENPFEKPMNVGKRQGVQELKDNLGDLLERFEWSVQPGLHVEMAGKDGVKDEQHMVLRLSTDGVFKSVKTQSFESGDKFRVSKDGKSLRIDTQLTAFWHRSPKHVWVQDRDELRLTLDSAHRAGHRQRRDRRRHRRPRRLALPHQRPRPALARDLLAPTAHRHRRPRRQAPRRHLHLRPRGARAAATRPGLPGDHRGPARPGLHPVTSHPAPRRRDDP